HAGRTQGQNGVQAYLHLVDSKRTHGRKGYREPRHNANTIAKILVIQIIGWYTSPGINYKNSCSDLRSEGPGKGGRTMLCARSSRRLFVQPAERLLRTTAWTRARSLRQYDS